MKLVAGLGNPGRKYAGTRHNVGFRVVAELARRYGSGKARGGFQGEVVDADLAGCRGVLLCPHTYMNKSGASVVAALEFYKLPREDLLVVCDDFHLPLARLRCRPQGSSGGQKGLADIIRRFGTEEVTRLRLGVGEPPAGWDPVDYVLGRFTPQELPDVEVAVMRAADAVVVWATQGIEACMNQYNSTSDA